MICIANCRSNFSANELRLLEELIFAGANEAAA
jgi:hypothetical protein